MPGTPEECFNKCDDPSNHLICKDAAECQKSKGYGLGDFKLAFKEENEHELWFGLLAYDPQVGWGTLCYDN